MKTGIVKTALLLMVVLACALPLLAEDKEEKVDDRIRESADVMKEILGMPEKGIPRDLLNKANCVIVYPSVKKAAFIVGGSYGRGLITCRRGANFSGHGALRRCLRSKAEALVSRSARKRRILCCW